ncbi:hypothetical protein H920_05333 [Fukomys damarensis]|uniref:Uncharacterized protein n=1 Tax=Fukomys damarensis TaxID=885580 RepID=A0A091DSB2_FUKDA|nr:hypothetical protein H920_05333 [Fukomys damarensis]
MKTPVLRSREAEIPLYLKTEISTGVAPEMLPFQTDTELSCLALSKGPEKDIRTIEFRDVTKDNAELRM